MSEVTYAVNTYAGELYSEIIWPGLVPALGLIDKGLVTPMPGIKKRTVIRSLDFDVEFQDPSCVFTPQEGDLEQGEKYIDPVKYEVMIEMCFEDVRQSWDAMKLKKGSLNDYQPPASLEAAFLETVIKKIGIMNEQLYINGKAGVTAGTVSFAAAYPGLLQRLRAGTDVNKATTESIGGTSMALTGITTANPGVVTVASTANLKSGDRVTITDADGNQQVGGVTINEQSFVITVLNATTFSLNKAVTGVTPATTGSVVFVNQTNAIALLSYIYSNIPDLALDNPDTKIWIPTALQKAYAFAQATVANGAGSYFIGKKELDFLGMALTPVRNMPANTILVAPSTNIFLGFDDSGDETNIRVTDMSKSTGDDLFRYKGSMKTDINYVRGEEILLISPETAGS